MSNTFKHKGRAYFNKGLKTKPEVKIYLNYCDRRNREVGFFTEIRNRIKNNILDNDMKHQLDQCFDSNLDYTLQDAELWMN